GDPAARVAPLADQKTGGRDDVSRPLFVSRKGIQRMHLDFFVAIAGLIVGFVVGLTGMAGGGLITPIPVLGVTLEPLAAVSSALVAALVMKPVGGAVHARRGTVNYSLVKWLMIGSVPFAFAGVFVLKALGDNATLQGDLKIILGVALL